MCRGQCFSIIHSFVSISQHFHVQYKSSALEWRCCTFALPLWKHTHTYAYTVFGMHGYMFIKNVGDDGGKSNNSNNNNIKIQNIFCGWLMLCAWPMIFFAPYTLHAKRYFDKSQPIPKILEKILILCLFLSFSIGLKSLRPCSYIDMNYFVYTFSVWFFFFFRHLENHKYNDLSNFERLFMVWHGGDTGQSVFVK